MSHNYDDLVINTSSGSGKNCTDYWRLDVPDTTANSANAYANLARPQATFSAGLASTTNLLPAANNNGSSEFNGSSNYITMPDTDLQYGSGFPESPYSFSVETWIKPAADQSTTDVIGLAQIPSSLGLYLAFGKPTFFTQKSGGSRINCSSSTAVSVGTIYYLVGTFNAATQDLKLYVNNTLVNTVNTGDTLGNDATAHNAGNLSIGSWDTSTLFFNGYISNVALYNFVLTTTQINAHYTYAG